MKYQCTSLSLIEQANNFFIFMIDKILVEVINFFVRLKIEGKV